ncbi:MAG: 1-deoxy-D-xylulose-5-phosphate reductoisomerase [Paludibacter sp.]|jgi:1-deoxy-D-xylulose-5-phosphate reductoisomerase|nr:1-deoxy-D-xylulose-5-phosphate reductoisomerase [Paludibacter sp.]
MQTKKIAILGSTGSIGTQTLQVINQHPDNFEVYALAAGNNVDLLIQQAKQFQPEMVAIENETLYPKLKEALADLPIKVFAGADSIAQLAELTPVDTVVTAMVGYAGLLPTIKAIEAGKRIALANKETLVVAGELILKLATENRAEIIPVDSEHSAIFQCLTGENPESVSKIILTASGGPFRQKTIEQLQSVKAADALQHPTWKMGAKVTIDSASLMNKGFEMIEAKWLFGLKAEQIAVVVHPQSIIHSMVEFVDGSIKAQLGVPDMKLPIQYALSFPQRLDSNFEKLDFFQHPNLTFEKADTKRFPNLALAQYAMQCGGNSPCILNAANEVVVDAFLHDKIAFLQMSHIIEQVIEKMDFIAKPSYNDYVETDRKTRLITKTITNY